MKTMDPPASEKYGSVHLPGGDMSENQDMRRGPKPLYGEKMTMHIIVPLPAFLNEQLIEAAKKLRRKKADLARTAIEDYLAFLDLN